MDHTPRGEAPVERSIEQFIRKNEFYRFRLDTFTSLYDAMVEGVAIHEIIYDSEGRAVDYKIVDINKAFETITSIPRKVAMGKLATHLYNTEAPPYLEIYERVAISGDPVSFDTHFPPMDKFFSISVISLGKGLFATIFFDITERKRLEGQLQQARKMEAVGTLAGGIAHDFNNILSVIMGNAEICIEDTPRESAVFSNLEEIKIACLRARDVVKQLMSFSRHSEQEKRPIRLSRIIKESLSPISASLPPTIHIRQSIPETLPSVIADPVQMNQIMMNLCANAAQAMEAAGGTMDISLSMVVFYREVATDLYRLPPGNYLKLIICDTGHGIDPEIQGRIFDPYFTTRPVGKGSGMGLAIVHGIIKSHGGGIFIDSEPGKGTRVSVYLPAIGGSSYDHAINRRRSSG